MSDIKFNVDVLYGHVRLVQYYEPTSQGGLNCFGYRIDYDKNGKETARTDPILISRLYYSEPDKPISLWQTLLRWMR